MLHLRYPRYAPENNDKSQLKTILDKSLEHPAPENNDAMKRSEGMIVSND